MWGSISVEFYAICGLIIDLTDDRKEAQVKGEIRLTCYLKKLILVSILV